MKKLRCRYEVWDRGRGVRSYQCQQAAKEGRELYIRPHRINGELVSERTEMLPVCGVHRNAWDRDPREGVHSAYQWSETDGPYQPRHEEYIR